MIYNIKQELLQAESDADSELAAGGWEEYEEAEERDDIQSEFDSVWSDRS